MTTLRNCIFLAGLIVFSLTITACTTLPYPADRSRGKAPVVAANAVVPKTETRTAERPLAVKPAAATAAPVIRPAPVVEKSIRVEKVVMLPDINFIKQRLSLYEKKLQQWLEHEGRSDIMDLQATGTLAWGGCIGQFEEILSGYSRLYDRRLAAEDISLDESAGINPWEILSSDIAFLESDCEKSTGTKDPATSPAADTAQALAVGQAAAIIDQHIENGKYEEAIALYQGLLKDFPDIEMPLRVKKLYGLALLRNGKLDLASQVFKEILAVAEQSPESWVLLRQTADLLLVLGNFDEAKSLYRQLADSAHVIARQSVWADNQLEFLNMINVSVAGLEAYMDLLKKYLLADPRFNSHALAAQAERLYQTFPESPVGLSANRIKLALEEKIRAWTTDKLAEVDFLVVDKDYQKALTILAELKAADLPVDLNRTVNDIHDKVSREEAIELEAQRQLVEQTLAQQWEKAGKLLDSRRYDEAIEALTLLLDTEYDAMARAKIVESEGKAATEKRKAAADIFVKASKTSDPEQKKEFLLASRRLLKEIMLKYPRVNIIDRVEQNLKIIEEEIRKYDPALLNDDDGQMSGNKEELSLPANKDMPQPPMPLARSF